MNKIALKVEILDHWGERSLSRKETRMANPLKIKFGPMFSWSHYCELLKVEEPLEGTAISQYASISK